MIIYKNANDDISSIIDCIYGAKTNMAIALIKIGIVKKIVKYFNFVSFIRYKKFCILN